MMHESTMISDHFILDQFLIKNLDKKSSQHDHHHVDPYLPEQSRKWI